MELQYNNEETRIPLEGCIIEFNKVSLHYKNAEENLSGFMLYDGDKLVKDCSDFIYRWDVLENDPEYISYTNDPKNLQTVKYNRNIEEIKPEPSEEEKLRADVDFLLMLAEE